MEILHLPRLLSLVLNDSQDSRTTLINSLSSNEILLRELLNIRDHDNLDVVHYCVRQYKYISCCELFIDVIRNRRKFFVKLPPAPHDSYPTTLPECQLSISNDKTLLLTLTGRRDVSFFLSTCIFYIWSYIYDIYYEILKTEYTCRRSQRTTFYNDSSIAQFLSQNIKHIFVTLLSNPILTKIRDKGMNLDLYSGLMNFLNGNHLYFSYPMNKLSSVFWSCFGQYTGAMKSISNSLLTEIEWVKEENFCTPNSNKTQILVHDFSNNKHLSTDPNYIIEKFEGKQCFLSIKRISPLKKVRGDIYFANGQGHILEYYMRHNELTIDIIKTYVSMCSSLRDFLTHTNVSNQTILHILCLNYSDRIHSSLSYLNYLYGFCPEAEKIKDNKGKLALAYCNYKYLLFKAKTLTCYDNFELSKVSVVNTNVYGINGYHHLIYKYCINGEDCFRSSLFLNNLYAPIYCAEFDLEKESHDPDFTIFNNLKSCKLGYLFFIKSLDFGHTLREKVNSLVLFSSETQEVQEFVLDIVSWTVSTQNSDLYSLRRLIEQSAYLHTCVKTKVDENQYKLIFSYAY